MYILRTGDAPPHRLTRRVARCPGTTRGACDDARMPALVAPLLTLAIGGLLVLTAVAGSGALLAGVIGAQIVLAYALIAADEHADISRDGVLVAIAVAAGAVALAVEDNPHGLTPSLGPVAYVVGPAVLLALMLRLLRSARREHLVEAFATTVTGVALVGMLAALIALRSVNDGDRIVVLTVTCATLAALPGLASWTTRPEWAWWVGRFVGVLLAATFAVVDIVGLDPSTRYSVGAAATIAGVLGAEVAVRFTSARASAAALVPTVAVALAAPPAYVLARVLLG